MKRTQKYRKGEALRPQPGAPTQRHCGDWQRPPSPNRCSTMNTPCQTPREGMTHKPLTQRPQEGGPQVSAGANLGSQSVQSP